MNNLFARRIVFCLAAIVLITFIIRILVVQFSNNYVFLALLPLLAFPIVMLKYFVCPNCGYDITKDRSSFSLLFKPWEFFKFPSECRRCGISFENDDGTNVSRSIERDHSGSE